MCDAADFVSPKNINLLHRVIHFENNSLSDLPRWRLLFQKKNIQPLEKHLKSQLAIEFQERVMHKQSHQNTHRTFICRKGRVFYFRFHVQRLELDKPGSDPLCLL